MHFVGAHVSTEGGVRNAPANAAEIGAKAFALFTKNQQQWKAKPLEPSEITSFRENCEKYSYKPEHILAHDGYLINLGNPDPGKRKNSCESFLDETTRCQQLGIPMLNMHPGSSLGLISEEQCMDYVSEGINKVLSETKGVTVVIETTAGQGSNVGYKFEHIAYMINKVDDKSRIGFCFDTCHIFAAGYDVRTAETLDKSLKEMDRIINLKYLRGVHLNDTKHDLGSRRDRHELIGKGFIKIDGFKAIMNDTRLERIPIILETPDDTQWAKEIKLLYSFQKKSVRTQLSQKNGKAQKKS